jgi:hypothetical protein
MSVAEDLVSLSERVRDLESTETYDIGSGEPTHYAAEGWRYWDKDADQLYINNDGANSWSLIGGGSGGGAAPHEILQTNVHTDSTTANVSRGSLITGQMNASGNAAWEELPLGAGNAVLTSDGSDAVWRLPDSWWSGGWIPLGGIILWSGAVTEIPFNWHLCDGTGGTPDLRDRFVVGAGGAYAVGATGGAVSQDLTHDHGPGTLETDENHHDHNVNAGVTANEAAHTHDWSDTSTGPSSTTSWGNSNVPPGPLKADHLHTHDVSGTTTAGTAHNHGPGTLETNTETHDHDVDAGTTDDALGVTSILNPYYALCYIMRMS